MQSKLLRHYDLALFLSYIEHLNDANLVLPAFPHFEKHRISYKPQINNPSLTHVRDILSLSVSLSGLENIHKRPLLQEKKDPS